MRISCTAFITFLYICLFLFGEVDAQTIENNWPQNRPVIIQTFNQQDGLPVVSMTDIVQGADNHLYVASSAGVSRFNGMEFETISTEQYPQLKSNRFLHLFTSPDSSVWMFDEQGFFSRWKKGKVDAFDSLFAHKTLPGWLLKVSTNGDAWISNGTDFMAFDKEKEKFIPRLQSLGQQYYDYAALSDSTIVILTEKGLYEYSGNTLSLRIPAAQLPFNPESQRTFYWETNLKQLPQHRVAISDSGSLAIFDLKSHEYSRFFYPDQITTTPPNILQVDDGLLLIQALEGHFNLNLKDSSFTRFQGTSGEEIWQTNYDPVWKGKRLYLSESSVNYNGKTIFRTHNEERIAQAVQDKEGNLWLTVAGRGLVRITLSAFDVFDTNYGLQSDNTYSIIEDKDHNIWLASFEFGVHRIGEKDIDYWSKNDGSLVNNLVWSLYERRNGDIMTSLWDNGLFRFDGKDWTPFLLNGTDKLLQTESFYEDKQGNFWIGSRLGLYKKEAQSDTFSQILTDNGSPIYRTQVIRAGPKGNVWLGTHGLGLQRYDEGMVAPVVFEGMESQPKIRDLYFAASDTIWIASETNGVIRAVLSDSNTLSSFQTIQKKEGLPDIGVHRILPDAYGFFWLTSNQGISRVSQKTLNDYLDGVSPTLWIETFTEKDGLPIRETNGGTQSNGIVASDSTIWIPTQRGVVHFNPRDFLNRNPFRNTDINVTSIRTETSNYNLKGTDSFSLPSGERSLTIDFDLVHYTNPDNIALEYRISALSSSWNLLSSDRQLSITNLPPGTHNIEMRLANIPHKLHRGNTFTLSVPYFFYEQTWFYFLMTGLLVSLITALFYATSKAAQKREYILNQRVLERTKLLNHQKAETEKALITIQQQANELEKLNKVKTDFFINMTHELRTPLALIKGPLGLLKNSSRQKNINQKEQLELIERNSKNLNNLVDRLLNLLQMETEEETDEVQTIDIIQFIRQRASQFESSEELAGKYFNIRLPSQEAFVTADPYLMESILNNLITNAIKYTRKGDSIEISADKNENSFMVEIKDTGIGIHKDDLPHIFDPFFRSENVSSLEGSGIGLSIVNRYMTRIGGEVTIHSELEKGTTIRLIFPEINSGENAVDVPSSVNKKIKIHSNSAVSPQIVTNVTISQKKFTILVVDDNQDIRLFLTRLLEEKFNILIATNGVHALEMLETQKPDLILSDVMMPKMNGIALAKAIRSKKELKFIPVILLSAKKTDDSIAEGLNSGAEVYLTKPIENQILIAQIETLLSREARLKERKIKSRNIPDSADQKFIAEIDELILRHLSDLNLSVEAIAEALHMSRPTLYRKWKKVSEINLNEYIVKTRLTEAIELIRQKGCTFAEASTISGFSDPAYFSRVFKKYYEVTPSEYFK